MNRVLIPPTLSVPPPRHPPHARLEKLEGKTMGTSWSVKLVLPQGLALPELRAGIQGELDRVVAQMSPWEQGSDLCRFNKATAGTWQTLPEEFYTVLDHALALARDTQGAYDPTVGPLVDLWGFGPLPRQDAPPSAEAVAEARTHSGWRHVTLDPATRRAFQPGGVRLDLCSIAKGFGVDLVAAYLRRSEVRNFLVEVGGELRGEGTKPDFSPWWVALERPPSADLVQTVLALYGLSVATSGDYRRYFEHGQRRYCHTIDPRTGFPILDRPASVSVLHPEAMAADALATALSVLGVGEGMAFARERNIAALFLSRWGDGFAEQMTPALAEMID
ncbi:FAD:protein FMN transferase [Telmatospirillum sp. J64-1]|uniref:FAD:protein FMN transferase n=1 Tax=Telmatospirillum sp. J64-1 TaxID=2502183 RepID=UPI00115D526F|nr:FAD:protein FMN transferase [Telmatospirillum sp. J64-1]